MRVRDIYNMVSSATQDNFFFEGFSRFEIINVNTEAHYRYSGFGDEICLGGDRSEILDKNWVLGLLVVDIDARENRVRIWVDG